MSFPHTYTARYYTSDDSFTRLPDALSRANELQVALAFARDYDPDGNSTNGVFKPHWNLENVTPTVISDFKRLNLPFKVNFFLVIGSRDQRYPFSVTSADQPAWVANATESLRAIIRKYHLDGIDIYYEHVTSTRDVFVDTIGQLIANLKKNGAITVASIALCARLNPCYYHHLYQKWKEYIGTVVYQSHNEETPITTISGLRNLFENIATHFYPSEKLLAGYSDQAKDWTTVSVPLYFATIGQAVAVKRVVSGPSIWTVTDEPGSDEPVSDGRAIAFEPKWVLELVNSAIIDNEL